MTHSKKLVYTAQSKRFFYCRDAVCEFVFGLGAIPINPFRAFDYFLGDRVPRDQVRAGNRRLLSVSDEVWIFGEELADGVLIEIIQAMQEGKPIRYFTIDNHADQIREFEPSHIQFEDEVSQSTGLPGDKLRTYLQNGATELVVKALGRSTDARGSVGE